MDWAKYIVFRTPSGLDMPVVFPNFVTHTDMRQHFPHFEVISAGSCDFGVDEKGNMSVSVFGESVSLKVKARKEEDSLLLARMFNNLGRDF